MPEDVPAAVCVELEVPVLAREPAIDDRVHREPISAEADPHWNAFAALIISELDLDSHEGLV